ncbi:MAG TPA: pentapeptide repeat-containing protein [Polyangiaceae bacterium]
MSARPDWRTALRADCERCFGLCCVAPAFARSADFALDKPAGEPCPNLGRTSFRCRIHASLRKKGFTGCTVFDCFGAGQAVAQGTFGGKDWRRSPEVADSMFQVFGVMRQLHQLLWYLNEALGFAKAKPLFPKLRAARKKTSLLAQGSAEELLGLDVERQRAEVARLLRKASESVRAGKKGRDLRGVELVAADLRGEDLRGASLGGACLLGADLRKADLRGADVIGADFRAADLRGADLRACLFLTQAQVDSAKVDEGTRLPRHFLARASASRSLSRASLAAGTVGSSFKND